MEAWSEKTPAARPVRRFVAVLDKIVDYALAFQPINLLTHLGGSLILKQTLK
jgi:hypothetical protein